ncbi:MAG: hypothetical protein ABJX32_15790 [Tateyamaria sp.]|uniref:hypothetical protein n=1 Tax=Tateyamaria sp. TaxID=1929288 RepID=UPI00329EC884
MAKTLLKLGKFLAHHRHHVVFFYKFPMLGRTHERRDFSTKASLGMDCGETSLPVATLHLLAANTPGGPSTMVFALRTNRSASLAQDAWFGMENADDALTSPQTVCNIVQLCVRNTISDLGSTARCDGN